MKETVGFIGLGSMGTPMCGHLRAGGHIVHVYARRAEVAAAQRALGGTVFDTPRALASVSDIICTNVTSTADVEEVLFGSHGVIEGARPGSVVLDFSTISAVATRDFAARLAERGVAMLDCPVSGGVRGAEAGTLSIMVGGPAEVLERVRPVLACLGKTITHIGDHGAGQVVKACNQIVQVVNIQGIAEAMHFARANGVDLERMLGALQAGFAGSRMLDMMGPKMAQRDFSAGIEARLHDKDFRLITELLDALQLDLPAIQLVARQLNQLVAHGWGKDDTSSLLRVLEAGQPGSTAN